MENQSPVKFLAFWMLICAAANCGGTDGTGDKANANPDQQAAESRIDLASYTLSMDKIDKLHKAQINIGLALKSMSSVQRESVLESVNNSSNSSVDDAVATIVKHKPYDKAIRQAGLTPREYTLIVMSMMQAAMANTVLQMRPGENEDSLLGQMHVNKANVTFVRTNQMEITRRQQVAADEKLRLGIPQDD